MNKKSLCDEAKRYTRQTNIKSLGDEAKRQTNKKLTGAMAIRTLDRKDMVHDNLGQEKEGGC